MFVLPQCIVVGVDGSKAALRAALWAVDEAAKRDVPLRLIYAMGQDDTPEAAEFALRCATSTVAATHRSVKIETDTAREPPVQALIRASASAAMVCVGALGMRHFRAGRMGSTTAAVAVSAHCPVAIIRDRDGRPRRPAREIVVEVDDAPDNGLLLGAAMEEALLRGAPVQAVICGRTAAADLDRRALAELDRRLTRWRRQYPVIQVQSLTVPGTLLDYLSDRQRPVQLVIVGSHDRAHLSELVGPAGNAVLHDADCSLLIVNRRHL
ncbi:hypothetical protein A5647_14170 [Mycobacterium sp. 1100029.7]|nr:hypothetical protein A5647_14170 [Mycobacterium sp. 1100029.7]